MEGIFLLLGSNLGDRAKVLQLAIKALEYKGIKLVKKSAVYETAAWGITDQQAFLNQVIQVDTSLAPMDLLKVILEIELELGRVRKIKWGERLIDIDILYYHDIIYKEDDLEIPHQGIPKRRFTLVPLVEICPEFIHPKMQLSQKKLLDNCEDNLEVSLFTKY
ncbi:2-amino-4-hydroxy-6-hydroxymethyldihydropteridine diphosphokinase [Marivirga salinae]|uniref:2-amino-4-hydroxy-6-hydroxymethyldihydropteridine pyrophosphokinase n=1 Tax=Marivirga salinarum TaxID=3059078 RepID=A0AA51R8S9_9BACT|nr:2-amino-4-hydroxy-6-hydroxymethyldihydropteridine diphosphokinase [Marivirga sp. BDSF4-3]WMN11537.1 2-amino-4-hydroxy-6-hydroxymethyldihydropteridine diphosphokinase [Marivirga sp. BDSF4-3]